jgi:hypothetical protein
MTTPQRTPSRGTTENGVRYRVTACRQRLRNSRTTHRLKIHSQIEAESGALAFAPVLVVDGVGATLNEIDDRAAIVLVRADQKVGIT